MSRFFRSSVTNVEPPSLLVGHRITERSAQALEHRRLEQETAQWGRLPVQHLVGEVVDDEPVIACEP